MAFPTAATTAAALSLNSGDMMGLPTGAAITIVVLIVIFIVWVSKKLK